jgi:hypothetical protein
MAVEPIETLKQIRHILKKSNDRELIELILDLQNELFALMGELFKVNAELTKLKREMDPRKKLHTQLPEFVESVKFAVKRSGIKSDKKTKVVSRH